MPSKEYRIWLDHQNYIVVEVVMVKGNVVSFVVRLMAITGDDEINVARYDTSHGAAHRDMIGRKLGLLRKEWYPDIPMVVVLQNAINDLRLNYEVYRTQYEAN